MKENQQNSTSFKIKLQKNDATIWEWGAGKKRFIFWVCGSVVILLVLFFCIFAFTPLKKLMPGYPSEAQKREAIRTQIKLDSLDREINLWKQQLHNIQLITSGQEPVVIRADSAYIELLDAANAELWGESEKQLKGIVEETIAEENE